MDTAKLYLPSSTPPARSALTEHLPPAGHGAKATETSQEDPTKPALKVFSRATVVKSAAVVLKRATKCLGHVEDGDGFLGLWEETA